jgi:hypothetical protein
MPSPIKANKKQIKIIDEPGSVDNKSGKFEIP